jgi:hypothetical protein
MNPLVVLPFPTSENGNLLLYSALAFFNRAFRTRIDASIALCTLVCAINLIDGFVVFNHKQCWVNGTDISTSSFACTSISYFPNHSESLLLKTLNRVLHLWCGSFQHLNFGVMYKKKQETPILEGIFKMSVKSTDRIEDGALSYASSIAASGHESTQA